MSSSRKSSASSTRSVSSASKQKIPHHLPKLPITKQPVEQNQKISFLNNVTEQDIKDDKAFKRYSIMMQQLNEIKIKDKKHANGRLSPLSPTPSKPKNLSLNGSKLIETNPASKSNRLSPIKRDDETDSDDDTETDDYLRKNLKAPNELLEEFLVYVLEKKWEDAHKLCKFILMYEPNNTTAKEFLPLIESKLSESSDEEDEDEEEDESSEDNDEEDDEDSDEDDESESDDEDEDEDEDNPKEDDDDSDILTPSVLVVQKN